MTDQDTRRIIDLIKDGRERTASEIGERLGIKPKVAGHLLATLRESGLVHAEKIPASSGVLGWRMP